MSAAAVIVAGGKGLRMKTDVRKQYLEIGEIPVLSRTIRAFDKCSGIHAVYIAAPADDINFCRRTIIDPYKFNTPVFLVEGGKERQESVFNGLKAVLSPCEIVAVHDGVRPFIDPDHIEACLQAAYETGACISGIPAFDTLKQADENGNIVGTIDRSKIWLAHTPQVFHYDLILEAHEQALAEGISGTDDASLVEKMGKPVQIIEGSRLNIKITTPEDLVMGEAIYQSLCQQKNKFFRHKT